MKQSRKGMIAQRSGEVERAIRLVCQAVVAAPQKPDVHFAPSAQSRAIKTARAGWI